MKIRKSVISWFTLLWLMFVGATNAYALDKNIEDSVVSAGQFSDSTGYQNELRQNLNNLRLIFRKKYKAPHTHKPHRKELLGKRFSRGLHNLIRMGGMGSGLSYSKVYKQGSYTGRIVVFSLLGGFLVWMFIRIFTGWGKR